MFSIRRSAFVSSTSAFSLVGRQSTWVCGRVPASSSVLSKHVSTRVLPGHVAVRHVVAPRSCASSPGLAFTKSVKTEQVGESGTFDFRLQYKNEAGEVISPWHDLAIYPFPDKQIVNYVNEIPRGNQAKMEIATDEQGNPIKQDVKKGALRFYKYGPSLVNYGAIPQTFEDPTKIDEELQVVGDGDPVDVTEIGTKIMPFGAIYKVKVLGCLGLLDEGEIDWKVIAINVDDPLATQVDDIGDVERLMPGRISEVREWFRMYKTAEGKGENDYAYDGEAKNKDFAMNVIEETHQTWVDLRSGKLTIEDLAV